MFVVFGVCLKHPFSSLKFDFIYRGFTYYQVTNLDNRISNADQLLTTDIDKFCDTVIDLYSNISKPILDISIYLYRLTVNLGPSVSTVLVFIYY